MSTATIRYTSRSWKSILKTIGIEILWSLTWTLYFSVILGGIILFPFIFPALAEVTRWSARKCGQPVAREAPVDGFGSWVAHRFPTVEFWRNDLPVALMSLFLPFISFIVFTVGIPISLVLVTQPFWVHSSFSRNINFFSFFPDIHSPGAAAWSLPLGIIVAAITCALLFALGYVRNLATYSLSSSSRTAELQHLTSQVSDLQRGRATIVESFDNERQRIERELHDGVQQHLIAISMNAGTAKALLEHSLEDNADLHQSVQGSIQQLELVQSQTEQSLQALRDVINGVNPPILVSHGLPTAIGDMISRIPIHIDLSFSCHPQVNPQSLPINTATTLYMATSEALTNIIKHAGVKNAELDLQIDPISTTIRITDRGCGGAHLRQGHGLAALSERMKVIGGSLAIHSSPEDGTVVLLKAPTQGIASFDQCAKTTQGQQDLPAQNDSINQNETTPADISRHKIMKE